MSGRIGPLLAGLLGVPTGTSVDELGPVRTCYSATPATPGASAAESSKLSGVARAPGFTRALETRIRAMATRWQYTTEDLAYALDNARENPAGWLDCCQFDEEHHAGCDRAGLPPISRPTS